MWRVIIKSLLFIIVLMTIIFVFLNIGFERGYVAGYETGHNERQKEVDSLFQLVNNCNEAKYRVREIMGLPKETKLTPMLKDSLFKNYVKKLK